MPCPQDRARQAQMRREAERLLREKKLKFLKTDGRVRITGEGVRDMIAKAGMTDLCVLADLQTHGSTEMKQSIEAVNTRKRNFFIEHAETHRRGIKHGDGGHGHHH